MAFEQFRIFWNPADFILQQHFENDTYLYLFHSLKSYVNG